ncbi:hypothetical protein Cni_G10721 [Canna indica]|uniref:Uncharacterized protein n=1 Tax=Canna indica TaxID=4628 RepID=A0AAQ3K757_9LILI|nr:hypothetical protein Cni_G10721 [Canna indica]
MAIKPNYSPFLIPPRYLASNSKPSSMSSSSTRGPTFRASEMSPSPSSIRLVKEKMLCQLRGKRKNHSYIRSREPGGTSRATMCILSPNRAASLLSLWLTNSAKESQSGKRGIDRRTGYGVPADPRL